MHPPPMSLQVGCGWCCRQQRTGHVSLVIKTGKYWSLRERSTRQTCKARHTTYIYAKICCKYVFLVQYATESCGLQEGSMKTALIVLITSKKGLAKSPNKFLGLPVSATCSASSCVYLWWGYDVCLVAALKDYMAGRGLDTRPSYVCIRMDPHWIGCDWCSGAGDTDQIGFTRPSL